MSTTKEKKAVSKRRESFDAKRAARFEASGVRVDNIDPKRVVIGFEGVDESESSECNLCDHLIKFLYVLHLGLTDGRVATFTPVGSSCIRTWAESLPVSEAQVAIIAALKLADEQVERIKASFRAFNALATNGRITNEDRDALTKFLSAPPVIRDNGFLADVAHKVEHHYKGWASALQRDSWIKALNREFVKVGKPLVGIDPESAKLIERAKAIIANTALLDKLSPSDRGPLVDITTKVEKQYGGTFASDKQRGFLASIVGRAERLGGIKTPSGPRVPVAKKAEQSGDESPCALHGGAHATYACPGPTPAPGLPANLFGNVKDEPSTPPRGATRPCYDGEDLPF